MITREPKSGDTVRYEKDGHEFVVDHVKNGIVYSKPPIERDTDGKCFIWKFADGTLNNLFTIID